jgi:hypothetical protein
VEFQTETCQEGAPEEVIRLKEEASRLLNTLKERLCRGRHREDITSVGSVELCQEGIERVHRVHQRTLFQVLKKGKCQREDTHRVVEYSVKKGSARCASSRRTQEGVKHFFARNTSN